MSTENKNNEIANALSDTERLRHTQSGNIATVIDNKGFHESIDYTDVIVEVSDSLDRIANAIIYLADSIKKD